jgi:hypothetical protein
MNRTTTVVVALIAAAGLSTMVYAVPEQRALAWGGFGGFGGCGFGFGGCGGFFGDGFHKHIIQTISQTNTCSNPSAHTPSPPPPPPPPPSKDGARGGSAGSGGAGGSGGEGGQGGKDVSDITSTNKANIDQKANGGNSNGGHAGNANGGDARTHGNDDDQKANSNDGQQANSNDGQDQRDNQVVCLNTAVNTAGHGFGANGVGQDHVPHVGYEGSENGVGHIIAKQQVIAVSSYGVHSGFGDHGFSHDYSPRYNYGPGYPIFPCGSGSYSTINGQIVCTAA